MAAPPQNLALTLTRFKYQLKADREPVTLTRWSCSAHIGLQTFRAGKLCAPQSKYLSNSNLHPSSITKAAASIVVCSYLCYLGPAIPTEEESGLSHKPDESDMNQASFA